PAPSPDRPKASSTMPVSQSRPVQQPPPRTLNASIDNPAPIVDEPFEVDVWIGSDGSGSAVSVPFDEPLKEPDWGDRDALDLLISLSGLDCEVTPGDCVVELRKTGNTKEVTFTVVAEADGPLELTIRVFLSRQMILLQSAS